MGKLLVTASAPEAVLPDLPNDRPVPLRHRPLAAAAPPSPLGDAIGQLSVAIESRLARLDNQMAMVRRLLVEPTAPLAPVLLESGNSVATVSCLGPFSFRLGGRPVDDWRSGKARALFQYLVTHRGRPIPREALIQALWPDPAAAAPGTSLKVAVHLLRHVLTRVEPAAMEIVSYGSCYQLSAANLWLDVEEFENCYAAGRSQETRGDASDALLSYLRAAELYRGDFLEEVSDDWPTFRREALKDQYLFVLARLATAAVEAGDYQDGITWCQRLLARDCCREDTYRRLMVCHARLGQRGRVRSWYNLCVRTLQAELDCRPDSETDRVYRLALAGKL